MNLRPSLPQTPGAMAPMNTSMNSILPPLRFNGKHTGWIAAFATLCMWMPCALSLGQTNGDPSVPTCTNEAAANYGEEGNCCYSDSVLVDYVEYTATDFDFVAQDGSWYVSGFNPEDMANNQLHITFTEANETYPVALQEIENGAQWGWELMIGSEQSGLGSILLWATENTINEENVITIEMIPTSTCAPPNLVGHWSFEYGFEADDLTGLWGPLNVNPEDTECGALNVTPGDLFFSSEYSGPDITEKTLMAWVTIRDLDVQSGSPLALNNSGGSVFDAIVYGELEPHRFMSGSDNHKRTQVWDPGHEELETDIPVCIAITYEDEGGLTRVTGYRNGQAIGTYVKGAIRTWQAGDAKVQFGPRHWTLGDIDMRILEARMYNRALEPSELSAIQPLSLLPFSGPQTLLSSDLLEWTGEAAGPFNTGCPTTALWPAWTSWGPRASKPTSWEGTRPRMTSFSMPLLP